MNVLFISRPGLHLFHILHESETAWDAIRFYGPIGLTIGVFIQVSTVAGAISLASDLRFFIRKYTSDHLFQMRPGVYYTAALARNRYLTRSTEISDTWAYRLMYWIENGGRIIRFKKDDWNSEEVIYGYSRKQDCTRDDLQEQPADYLSSQQNNLKPDEIMGGYLLEVWCTRSEYEII